jgi:chemotaxis protein methyltransferase CheR
MNREAGLDRLADVMTARLGLGPQNLRREKLREALDRLSGSGSEAEAIADLRQGDLRDPAWQAVIAAATIPETRFLRQRGWFRQIEALALAPLVKRRRQRGDRRIRIWSAGCASGEEAYTLAMLLRDLIPDLPDWRVEILATDINVGALREAERGLYSARQLRELDPVEIARHFEAAGTHRYAVRTELRGMVGFHFANLAEDPHPGLGGPFDLILCRNVLIYLTPETQRRVAGRLSGALAEDGWLAVAPAEAMVDWFRSLTPVNAPEAILFCKAKRESREAPPSFPPPQPVRPEPVPIRLQPPVAGARAPMPARPVSLGPASLEEVRHLADRGALAEARARCGEILGRDALNGDACLLLSAICSELGDVAAAYDAARQAIYLMPASAEAHFQLAGVLRSLGQGVRAKRTMETASRLAQARAADAMGALTTTETGAGDGDNR